MNYRESISYLEKAVSFGIKPGLERISALLKYLGNPEKKYKIIHVTGTNGKGSTTAMITAALEAAHIKAGRYVSPHLVEYTERIYAMGKDISREDFAYVATAVRHAAESIVEEGYEAPTEFELLTAMAFLYFAKVGVEYAVVEVGMGGLYDSTNVIVPVVSVITNVAMDHMQYLGNTLTEIAHNKAGIIKESVPCVTAASGEALTQIQKEAEEKHAPLYIYGRDFAEIARHAVHGGQIVSFCIGGKETGDIHISLVGPHQAINAAGAVMALKIVSGSDPRVTGDAVCYGLAHTRWPGRFDMHHVGNIPFVMDGAHNSAGAVTLKASLEEQFPDKRRLVVFTSLKDKDTDKVIRLIMRPQDKVFITTAPTPRSRSEDDIAAMLPCPYKEEPDTDTALNDAVAEAKDGDMVLVCGSLYILGEVITWLNRREDK